MPGLRDHDFKRAYHKPEDDIAGAFYLPAVRVARRYDRAVGFFSSSIFLLAWPSLKAFVEAGGRMRLICSPVLSDDDHDAMREGYSEQAEAACADRIADAFARLMATGGLAKPAVVLASLVALGVIDCKIAWVGPHAGGRPRRLFHDKMGLLADDAGNAVVFKGSMNETWPGLARDGNLESVDVFASWRDDGERARIDDEIQYFKRLWEGAYPGVTTRPLPDTARAAIVSAADAARWPEFVDEICHDLERAARWSADASRGDGRIPRPHQIDALEAWQARGRRGIFEHATGSGKTFTALCAIQDGLHRGEIPLVLVPSDLLLQQWLGELRSTFGGSGLQLMVCGAGHGGWRESARLRGWTRPGTGDRRQRAVLSTLQTAAGAEFMGLCVGGDHLFMVADEVHRMGAPGARRLFGLATGARLGLSATPRRAGDSEGTAAVMDYFGGVVPPPFTLQDAISSEALTPYAYYAHTVRLDLDEQQAWVEATKKFRHLYARLRAGGAELSEGDQTRLKLLLIERARIIKGARRKVQLAAEVVGRNFRPGQRWIVYCDGQDQLGAVKAIVRAAGIEGVYEYHSAMPGDRTRTLDVFNERGGVVVSIRCLDEGVDIPAVSHALILASSKNPREFIQRRGRVLRRSPGKALAHVHDALVVPEAADADDLGDAILKGELARAIEFGTHAVNPGAVADLRRLAAEVGVDWSALENGFEIDGEDASPVEGAYA